jgi:ubiquinone/menaquinone biosynthesis C-methylase UbiE
VSILALLAGLIVLAAVVYFGWRVASRRRSLPCPAWLAWAVERDNPFATAHRAAAIIASLDLRPGMAVLDVGCGPGRLAVPIAAAVGATGSVVAVDIQPAMLRLAEAKARDAGVANIRFLHATAGTGRLERAQFDRALLVAVLGEIPDRAAALAEIFAALKPGGVLSVTETMFDPHYQSRRTVTRLAAAAGFRELARHGNAIAFTLILATPAAGIDSARPRA